MDSLWVCFGWEHERKLDGSAVCQEGGSGLRRAMEGSLEETQRQAQPRMARIPGYLWSEELSLSDDSEA